MVTQGTALCIERQGTVLCFLSDACESADIYEADAAFRKYDEGLYFGYYISIANCYEYTEKDPYCYDVKNMKRTITTTREGWLNLEL